MLTANEANRRYFHEAYRTGKHGWAVHEPSPYAVRYLERLKGAIPGGALLDVGCGEGRHAFAASRLGFGVTAIDDEPLALKRAREIAEATQTKRVTFRKASIFSAPFCGSSFDCLLDYGCLHHQRKADWPAYKTSVLRLLKPQGYYVLSVFSPGFRLFRGRSQAWHIAYGAYRRCFTREDLLTLFGRDFDILDMKEERGGDGGFWHVLMRIPK